MKLLAALVLAAPGALLVGGAVWHEWRTSRHRSTD